jgi:hypothetical protein
MKIKFLIIHSYDNVKNVLTELVKETLEEEFLEEEIEISVEILYNHEINPHLMTLFSLILKEEGMNRVIKAFCEKLRDNDMIHLLLKFFDKGMFNEYRQYSEEIFKIEMELREALSFIFLDTYDRYYDLLSEVNVKLQKHHDLVPDEDYFKCHFENEFFFILFSDYRKLLKVKEMKKSDLVEAIKDFKNYENLRQKILNRGITKERYREFLSKIKGYLESIEGMRNCIAHNRSIPSKTLENYKYARDQLQRSIQLFWKQQCENSQENGH